MESRGSRIALPSGGPPVCVVAALAAWVDALGVLNPQHRICVLDEECVEGMRGFFRIAAECGVLPPYNFTVEELASR